MGTGEKPEVRSNILRKKLLHNKVKGHYRKKKYV